MGQGMTPYISASIGYYVAADDIPLDAADIAVPERPDDDWTWNATAGAWRLTIATVRTRARARILSAYIAACSADIAVAGIAYRADADGLQALRDAVVTARELADLGLPATVDVLDATDTLVTLARADIVAVWRALQARTALNRVQLRDRLAAIKAAATKPAINAVVW